MQVVQHTTRSFADVVSSGLPGPTKKTRTSFDPVPRSQVETAPSVIGELLGVEKANKYRVPTCVCPCPYPRANSSAVDSQDRRDDAHEMGVFRVGRASQDELSTLFEQLAVSARILTAISLQNGLVDGTISPDAVTAELLNIGAAELELLKAFDGSKVNGLVEKMKTIGPSLDADTKTVSMENVIVLMNEWRLRIEDVGDVKDTSLIDSHLKAVGNTKSFDKTLVDKIERAAAEAVTALNAIPTLDQETDNVIRRYLESLQDSMGILAGAPKTLAPLTQDLQKKRLVAEEKSISTAPQIKFVDFLDEFFLRRGEITQNPPGDYEKLVQVFSSVFSLVSDAKASEGEMRVMGAVSNSRKPLQDRNITSGFLNGLSDIGSLPSDADNEQFKDLIGGFDTDVLKMGLTPLQSLMMKAADVEKKWSGMAADWIQATEDFRKICEMLITSGTPTDKATLLMLDKCNEKPNSPSDFYDGINALVKNTTALRNQIDSMAHLSEELSDSLRSKGAELLKVKDAIKFSSKDATTMTNEAKSVLAKFKKHSTTEVLAYLGEVTPKVTALGKGLKDVSSLIQNFPDAKKSVAALLAASEMKEFEKFFACMKSLPSQFASASSTVALTRKIRKFVSTPALADNVNKVLATIDKSRNTVGTLQKACAAMKGSKSSEIEEIGKLGVSVKDTNSFGVSVMAVGNMRKFGNKKVQIEKFLVDGEKVGAAIQRVQDAKTRSQLKAAWGDFPKMKEELGKLAVDLEAKRGTMVVPKAVRFADLGPMLGGLVGMLDANLPIPDLRMVLEALIPTNSDLAPMMSLFDGTDPSDFRFARFNSHLGEVVGFLPIIDKVLVSFVPNSPLGRLMVTTSGSGFPIGKIVIGVIGLLVGLIVMGAVIWLLIRWCKRSDTKPAVITPNGETKTDDIPTGPSKSAPAAPKRSEKPVQVAVRRNIKPRVPRPRDNSTEPPKSAEADQSKELSAEDEDPSVATAFVKGQRKVKLYINKKGQYMHRMRKGHITKELMTSNIRKDMWVEKDFKTPTVGDHDSIMFFKRVQRDESITAAKQYYDDRAKMANPNQHFEEHYQYLNETRDECPNFNFGTAPVIENGFFYHCTQIAYSLHSEVIVGQAPWKRDSKDKKPENKLPEKRNKAGSDHMKDYYEDEDKQPRVKEDDEAISVQDSEDELSLSDGEDEAIMSPEDEAIRRELEPGSDCEGEGGGINSKEEESGIDSKEEESGIDSKEESSPSDVNDEERKQAGVDNKGPCDPKIDTEPSFWKVVVVKKCPHIVQCCSDKETSDYYPKKLGEVRTPGRYRITCTKVTLKKYVGVDQRVLLIQDVSLRKKHQVVHWIIHGWKQGDILPVSMIPSIISVILETRLTDDPPFVISKLGRGRAGVFVFIEFYFQMLLDCRQKCATSLVALDLLRYHRYWIIDNGIQFFFAILVTYAYVDWEWRQWFKDHDRKMKTGDHIIPGYYLANNKAVLDHFNDLTWHHHIENEMRIFAPPKNEALQGSREETLPLSLENEVQRTDNTQEPTNRTLDVDQCLA